MTLATLVNRRLLRIEERLDMRRVELTHDVLCGVVLASRNLRQRARSARTRLSANSPPSASAKRTPIGRCGVHAWSPACARH